MNGALVLFLYDVTRGLKRYNHLVHRNNSTCTAQLLLCERTSFGASQPNCFYVNEHILGFVRRLETKNRITQYTKEFQRKRKSTEAYERVPKKSTTHQLLFKCFATQKVIVTVRD